MEKNILASCQCGNVSFESTENPVIQLCCHCTDCRNALGTDFATISFFNVAPTKIIGDLDKHEFVSNDGNKTVREYCINCNDVMFDRSSGFPTLIGVMSSKIKSPFKSLPVGHIWVDSKLENVKIPEGMKQFEKGYF